jgi:hypothetical protein
MPHTYKALGFAGFCKTDIILYFSRIFHLLGEKVAIIDQSNQEELRHSIPTGIFTQDRVDYRGVDVFLHSCNTPISNLKLDDYTVLLIDFGVNEKALDCIDELKALFIVTDCKRHHTVPLSSCISHITGRPDSIRIIRDLVNSKINTRYIDSLLQSSQYTNVIAKYEFGLNENEHECRLKSQYDDIFKFTRIPGDLKNMLIDCIMGLFSTEKKAVQKALKKAQRGG